MQPVDLFFEAFGEPGPTPLLIVHGFFASSRNWRSIARQLAAVRPVYVLDMRNHGNSPHAKRMNYAVMAEDVLAFMASRGLARAHILGHSMGGKIAMWLALQHPQRIERLVIADIAPVAYQHSFDRTIQALIDLPLERINNRKHAEQYLEEAIPDGNYRQFLLQNLQLADGHYYWRIDLDIFKQNADHIVGFPDTAGLQVYREPALFLAGERSDYVRPEAVRALFPASKIVSMADTGHWLHAERPDAFVEQVEMFLTAAD